MDDSRFMNVLLFFCKGALAFHLGA